MIRSRFPRVLELIDLIEDRGAAGAYFREFETRVEQDSGMARVWSGRELEFQKLDNEAWSALKTSAAPYLVKGKPNGRGWSQLISILNEARGYIYLSEMGCTEIRFIPRVKKEGIETPDLIGELDATRALCEVKTILISDIEIRARRNIEVRSAETSLTPEFLKKLDDTLDKARNQLFAYEGGATRSGLCLWFSTSTIGRENISATTTIKSMCTWPSRPAETMKLFFSIAEPCSMKH